MRQKLRYGRPCTHDLPGTHNWLAQLHIASFFRVPLTISCWHNPGSLEWVAAPLAWLTPRPAPERLCLWLLDMSTDPPFYPICSKRVTINWAWAEDSDDMFRILWEWPRKKTGDPPPKTLTTSGDRPTPSPPGLDLYIYIYIPINSSWRQDSEYINF